MTIDDLIEYCMEEETIHRIRCEKYDDASGYTRSKNKDIRTACAVREELFADYYQQIASIIRKYQKIEQIIKDHDNGSIPEKYWHIGKIREVLEDENFD